MKYRIIAVTYLQQGEPRLTEAELNYWLEINPTVTVTQEFLMGSLVELELSDKCDYINNSSLSNLFLRYNLETLAFGLTRFLFLLAEYCNRVIKYVAEDEEKTYIAVPIDWKKRVQEKSPIKIINGALDLDDVSTEDMEKVFDLFHDYPQIFSQEAELV